MQDLRIMTKDRLPKEVEEGNIEYKLKLINKSNDRLQQLITQLKWRIREGRGIAIYAIGVSDNGTLVGITPAEMEESLQTLKKMGEAISAECFVEHKRKIKGNEVCEVLFKKSDENTFKELRIAILGAADAGKSTLLSVLSYGDLDDGNGMARLNLLRHRHEIETGRSSSISRQIIGYNSNGNVINYASDDVSTWDEICYQSTRIVTFMDTCGHPKYEKTTLKGLTGDSPHYICLMLSASYGGLPKVAKDQIFLSKALNIPLLIFITKIDIANGTQLQKTLTELLSVLKSPQFSRMPVVIQNELDLASSMDAVLSSKVVPLFLISCVTGDNIELLKILFYELPRPLRDVNAVNDDILFQIQETFDVPDIGTVVAGTLKAGRMFLSGNVPQLCFIGPDNGRYVPVIIHSIHRQRCMSKDMEAGQLGTCAIKFAKNTGANDMLVPNISDRNSWTEKPPILFRVRRGQVLISAGTPRVSYWTFQVKLHVIAHTNRLSVGQELNFFCGPVSQPVKVAMIEGPNMPASEVKGLEAMKEILSSTLLKSPKKRKLGFVGNVLTPGSQGTVYFRFSNESEYLTIGSTVLVRAHGIKCVGKITGFPVGFEKHPTFP